MRVLVAGATGIWRLPACLFCLDRHFVCVCLLLFFFVVVFVCLFFFKCFLFLCMSAVLFASFFVSAASRICFCDPRGLPEE